MSGDHSLSPCRWNASSGFVSCTRHIFYPESCQDHSPSRKPCVFPRRKFSSEQDQKAVVPTLSQPVCGCLGHPTVPPCPVRPALYMGPCGQLLWPPPVIPCKSHLWPKLNSLQWEIIFLYMVLNHPDKTNLCLEINFQVSSNNEDGSYSCHPQFAKMDPVTRTKNLKFILISDTAPFIGIHLS